VYDRLAAGEDIEQGKIGVILEPDEPSLIPLLDKILPPTPGVRIKEVARYSPAERAKLKDGDKITAIDGKPTGDLMEIQRRLSDRAAGEEITLTIKRRWRTFDVTLTLARAAEIGRKPKEEPATQTTGDSDAGAAADEKPAEEKPADEQAEPRPVAD
jgi:S1-C subfamily serine protease